MNRATNCVAGRTILLHPQHLCSSCRPRQDRGKWTPRCRHSPVRDIAVNERDAQLLADLRGASAMALHAALFPATPLRGQNVQRELALVTRPIPLSLVACKNSKGVRQKHRIKTTTAAHKRREKFTSSSEEFWDSNTQDIKSEKRKLRNRKPKNNEGQKLLSQRIDQQSYERARVWSSCAFNRISEALDHSPDSSEFWPRYKSLGRGTGSSNSSGLGCLTMKWATRDLPEACRVFLNRQLKKDFTTKIFDDGSISYRGGGKFF